MAYIPEQRENTGSFLPTTSIFDVGLIQDINVNAPEFKELLIRLYQNVNNIVLTLNSKETAFYLNEEFATGGILTNPSSSNPEDGIPIFREVVTCGALGAGVTSTNHNLTVTSTWKWLAIYGAATNSTTPVGYPLPFSSAAGNNIEVTVTATQVVINNTSGVTFTDSKVILMYSKV